MGRWEKHLEMQIAACALHRDRRKENKKKKISCLLLVSRNNTQKERGVLIRCVHSLYTKNSLKGNNRGKGRREGRLKNHQKIKRILLYKMSNEQDMKTKKDKTPKRWKS